MHETGAAGLTKGCTDNIVRAALYCVWSTFVTDIFSCGNHNFYVSFCSFVVLLLLTHFSLLLSFIDISRFGEKRLPKAIILYRGNVHPFLFRCTQSMFVRSTLLVPLRIRRISRSDFARIWMLNPLIGLTMD